MKQLCIIAITLIFGINMFGQVSEVKNSVFVLCYHTFLESSRGNINFSESEVKEQIKYLKEKNYKFVTLEEVLDNKIKGDNNILITIDDGHHSGYKAYYDIFKPEKIRPVYAIPIGLCKGTSKYYLDKEQIKKLSEDADFSVHGYNHRKLTKDLYNRNSKQFEDEVKRGKFELENITGRLISTFTFCFGSYDDFSMKEIKKYYKYGFLVAGGKNSVPMMNFGVKRYVMERTTWRTTFKQIVASTKNSEEKVIETKEKQHEDKIKNNNVVPETNIEETKNSEIINSENEEEVNKDIIQEEGMPEGLLKWYYEDEEENNNE